MILPRNIVTFLRRLPLKNMRGEDVLIAVAFFLAKGSLETEIEVKEVIHNWSKSVVGKKYNSAFFARAKGRIHPTNLGKFNLTDEGVSYIQELVGEISTHITTLLVFQPSNTHSFDKFLREVLKKAVTGVDIADTYVDGNLFDTLLDEVPKTTPIRFVYGTDVGGFMVRARRFAGQYKIEVKESKQFHDRVLIIDGKGYVVGPSLKDAADRKPATIVTFNVLDSKKLTDLFDKIWKNAK